MAPSRAVIATSSGVSSSGSWSSRPHVEAKSSPQWSLVNADGKPSCLQRQNWPNQVDSSEGVGVARDFKRSMSEVTPRPSVPREPWRGSEGHRWSALDIDTPMDSGRHLVTEACAFSSRSVNVRNAGKSGREAQCSLGWLGSRVRA